MRIDWPDILRGHRKHFALYDALLEAGAPEIAEHFREERIHHPDCCGLQILGQATVLDVTYAETPQGMLEIIFGDPDAPRPQGILHAGPNAER